MKRSKAMTVLGIIFGLLTLAGLGDAIVIFSGAIDAVPAWLGVFTLIFGLAAGAVAYGLWRVRGWGLVALRYWFVACLMLLLAAALAFYPAIPGGIVPVIILTVVVTGICLALDKFVASNFEGVK